MGRRHIGSLLGVVRGDHVDGREDGLPQSLGLVCHLYPLGQGHCGDAFGNRLGSEVRDDYSDKGRSQGVLVRAPLLRNLVILRGF